MQQQQENSTVVIDVSDEDWKSLFPNSTFWQDSDSEEEEAKVEAEIFIEYEDKPNSDSEIEWENTVIQCFKEIGEAKEPTQVECKVEVQKEIQELEARRERIRLFNLRCEERQKQRQQRKRTAGKGQKKRIPTLWTQLF